MHTHRKHHTLLVIAILTASLGIDASDGTQLVDSMKQNDWNTFQTLSDGITKEGLREVYTPYSYRTCSSVFTETLVANCLTEEVEHKHSQYESFSQSWTPHCVTMIAGMAGGYLANKLLKNYSAATVAAIACFGTTQYIRSRIASSRKQNAQKATAYLKYIADRYEAQGVFNPSKEDLAAQSLYLTDVFGSNPPNVTIDISNNTMQHIIRTDPLNYQKIKQLPLFMYRKEGGSEKGSVDDNYSLIVTDRIECRSYNAEKDPNRPMNAFRLHKRGYKQYNDYEFPASNTQSNNAWEAGNGNEDTSQYNIYSTASVTSSNSQTSHYKQKK